MDFENYGALKINQNYLFKSLMFIGKSVGALYCSLLVVFFDFCDLIKNCKYELIARMDPDEVALSQHFEKQVKFLKRNKEIDVVGIFIHEINENNQIIKDIVKFPVTHQEFYDVFAKREPLAYPTLMFKKSYFKKIGEFYTERFVGINKQEDSAFWFKVFYITAKFSNIPEVLSQ